VVLLDPPLAAEAQAGIPEAAGRGTIPANVPDDATGDFAAGAGGPSSAGGSGSGSAGIRKPGAEGTA